jgi:hypothetical protein
MENDDCFFQFIFEVQQPPQPQYFQQVLHFDYFFFGLTLSIPQGIQVFILILAQN